MIAQEDYDFIMAYEASKTKQDRDALLEGNKMQCARTMINFITTVAKDQNVRYVLTLLDDMIMVSVPMLHLCAPYSITLSIFLPVHFFLKIQ